MDLNISIEAIERIEATIKVRVGIELMWYPWHDRRRTSNDACHAAAAAAAGTSNGVCGPAAAAPAVATCCSTFLLSYSPSSLISSAVVSPYLSLQGFSFLHGPLVPLLFHS